jgi:two-component system OmpR family response regulator
MRLQRRAALATAGPRINTAGLRLQRHPPHRRSRAYLEPRSSLPSRHPRRNLRHHTLTKILRTRRTHETLQNPKSLGTHSSAKQGIPQPITFDSSQRSNALDQTFDVVVMDRMLPGMDGLNLVKSLRAGGVETPVIFLTALGGVGDRVEGLEAGADDYLVKPFSFSELNARVNALARRPPFKAEVSTLQVGPLELNRLQRTVKLGDRPLDLKPKEFALLEYLMQNAGRVVTRTMLLEHVWDFHFDPKTTIVETHISRIRAKIDGERAGGGIAAPQILTVRGAGYMLAAD